jgi:hypothetical protein
MALPETASGGQVFVTGHDPDFHASLGPNAVGAQHIIQDALTFTRNGNTAPILVIQSDLTNLALGDHTNSVTGLNDSGFSAGTTPGNHYVIVNAATFSTLTLAQVEGFSSIFIPSDHGGTLTGNDLQALDGRAADILTYLNAGGGLVAFAEDGNHQPPTSGPAPALFGFLPFLVTSTAFSELENGNTLTPAGTALGLVTNDINGNFSHNIFTATGGMTVVDRTATGAILSLDFQGQLGVGGVVPEPNGLLGIAGGILGLAWFEFRRRRTAKTHS